MTTGTSDVRRLAGHGGQVTDAIPRPRRRFATRILLPAVIILGVLSVAGYVAWRALEPVQDVWVMPVISRPTLRLAGAGGAAGATDGGQGGAGAVLSDDAVVAVAPGWVEPDPYAVTVAAYAPGVVKEVLALEGERVQAGDVVARLDATDAALFLRRAQAEREAALAEEVWAAALAKSAETQVQDLQAEIGQRRQSSPPGTAPAGQGESAEFDRRLRSAGEALTQSRLVLAKAQAQLRAREVMVEQATLHLARHEVRSPVTGLVMARLVEPGTHIGGGMGMSSEQAPAAGGMAGMPGMGGTETGGSGHTEDMSGAVLRVFDPAKLQARAEVGVADSMKIAVGMPAQMTSDAAPELAFRGVITRIVPAVDKQKNTLEVKVAIQHSEGMLRPGMQMRIKFFKPAPPAPEPTLAPEAPASPAPAPVATREGAPGALRIMAPTRGLRELTGNRGKILVAGPLDSGGNVRLEERELTIVGEPESGYVEVNGPITAGERVVVRAQRNAEPGERVHVAGELSAQNN